MACPDETTIERFLAARLDELTRRRVKAHFADCTPCCELVGALVMSTASQKSGVEPVRGSTAGDSGGARLSRYRIERPLGAGGMGIVYSAYDPELDRRVALKVLWSATAGGPAGPNDAGRLHREARAMAKLAHPNVVRIFDVGVEDDRVFLAMELVDGGTMREWMRQGPHPWPQVLARFRQAGAGLVAAHHAGLIHRDFKPENLLLRSDGTVLVSDFGLAHEVPFGEVASTLSAKHKDEMALAPDGAAAGTPAYMAPEQLRGETLDARADVYAFSIAMWEALYGTRPFSPTAEEGLLGTIAKGPPDPEQSPTIERVPKRLRNALARGMSFHRRDRPASLTALLAECAVDEPAARKGRAWKRVAILVGIGAAMPVAGIVVGRSTAPLPPSSPVSSASSFNPSSVRASEPVPTATSSSSSSIPLAATTPSAVVAEARTSASSTPPVAVSSAKSIPIPPAPNAKARRGAIRGMDFAPYGFAASDAADVVKAHASDFDACWADCVEITCRFEVETDGRVARSTCSTWEGKPACPVVEGCLAQRIRALRFPASPKAGECKLFFGE